MSWQRDTREQIFERALSNINTRLPGADARLPLSNLNVLAYLHAEAMHALYGYGAYIARQIDPRTADIETIQQMATLWLAQPQKPAEAATGAVQFTGTNGAVIPAGTILNRSDAAEFITMAEGVIAASVALVVVEAVVPGQASNTAAGSTLSLASPLPDPVNSEAVVQAGGLSGGADAEDVNTSVRARLITRMRLPPHGGAKHDYEQWALEVPGVTRVWVFPAHFGEGTVGIYFVRDEDASIIPDAGEVSAVQAYIDARRPVASKGVTVFAPIGVSLNMTIELLIDTSQAVKDAIEASIKDVLQRNASPGGTIFISHLREAISIAAGEVDHVLTVPSANVAHTTGQIALPGVITWV